jgi:hypothetical protein
MVDAGAGFEPGANEAFRAASKIFLRCRSRINMTRLRYTVLTIIYPFPSCIPELYRDSSNNYFYRRCADAVVTWRQNPKFKADLRDNFTVFILYYFITKIYFLIQDLLDIFEK